MINGYIFIMLLCTGLSAASQILLKKSTEIKYKKWIYEYLNWRVLLAYFIFFGVLLANTYAYTKVELKYGAIIDSLSYFFVLVFSWWLLKERFSKKKLIGNLLIMTGVVIYSMPF